jgi:hypothetical protein
MNEADQWRERAREWFALAESAGDDEGAKALSTLAEEALMFANELDAESCPPLTPDQSLPDSSL